MSLNLKGGLKCVNTYTVEEQHTAKHIGSGSLKVLATPAMIAFMEHTAMICVEKYLPKGMTTVGTHVDVRHKLPVPLGAKVKVEAILEKVDGRRLIFSVKAFLGDRIVGEGIHERYIVDVSKFLEKVKKVMEEVETG